MSDADIAEALRDKIGDLEDRIKGLVGDNNDLSDKLKDALSALDDIRDTAQRAYKEGIR